ncbi:hypothetical protein ACPXCG_08765 [Gordonia sp. DT218]|uniref:hypothetical protein n=1 Tax=unclassified Gordonia (in: high G+C Gram-positive bacteria) TaxID=2657482 RepID=UPI003CF6E1E7
MVMQMFRIGLVLTGCVLVVRGLMLIWSFSSGDQLSIVLWLAAGLLAHDLVFAPLCLLVAAITRRALPPAWCTPVLLALAYTNLLVLLALPVLAPRPAGERPDNSTILDRPFGWGLTIAILLVWAILGVVMVASARRRRASM